MRNVVVVDDDRIIRKRIVNSIRWDDFLFNPPYEASNGRDGLGLILEIVPDLVITDVCMPLLDGVSLIGAVRERFSGMKFLLLSNYSNYEYLRGAVRFGAVDYLLKCEATPQDIRASLQSMDFEERKDASRQERDLPAGSSRPEIAQAIAYIRENFDGKLTLGDIARHVNLSQSHFCRLFKQELGYSFVDYLKEVRVEHAKRLLQTTSLRISEISERLGFSSCDYFTRVFHRMVGSLPTEYRKNDGEAK